MVSGVVVFSKPWVHQRNTGKIIHAIAVGNRAPTRIPPGDTSLLKYFFGIETPAGLGALAMMVL